MDLFHSKNFINQTFLLPISVKRANILNCSGYSTVNELENGIII